jgi:tetratricopeptide (TPR) repeat protein/energy-coupling factor transporter ATP-binding protein EcfA2
VFNPFPGLRPFEPNEDHLFFGREKEIDDLLRRLRAGRFLAIIGTSGCGKSSLVRSGLIPSLGGGAMSDTSSDWKIALMRPGEDPLRHLAHALNAPEALGPREKDPHNAVLLEATLRRGTRGLVEVVRQARIEKGANALVVVDQFEELFRFKRNTQVENARDESAAFVKILLEAAGQRDFPIYVVLTMRSDFIGDCMEFTGLPEAVNDGLYLVPRMSRDEVRLAITGPVAVGGGKISQRLVLRLLNDFGDDLNQLPVLQHALMRTWDHWQARVPKTDAIDIDDYEAIGTIKQALSIHAEEAYEEAGTPERQRIVEKIFKGLTDTFSDPRGIRRPTSMRELTAIAEAPAAEVQSVIELFRRPGRSFLTPGPDVPLEDQTIVDVSHESLMRCWQRLKTWAEEERRSAEVYSRLSAAARWHEEGSAGLWRNPELEIALRWREKNRPTQAWAQRFNQIFPLALNFLEMSEAERTREDDEKRHERRKKLRQLQWTAGILASLLLVTVVFALIAIRQRRIARENLQIAMNAVDESLSTAGRQQAREAGDLPEIQAFRKDLLDKAATFYTLLAKQNKNSPEFLAEEARAHARLGDIDRLMGRDADAVQEYSDSIDRFSTLVKQDAKQAEYRASLAYVHNWLGETIRTALDKAATFGKYTRNDAESEYSQAIALQEALHSEEPGNANYQQQLARTHYNRGINRYYAQNADGAKADFLQAIALLEPLVQVAGSAAKETNREPEQDLARVYNNYAIVMAKAKDTADAERYYDQSIALAEQLVAKQPQNREYKAELSQYALNEARMEADSGQMDDADAHGKRALDLLDQLSKPTPTLMLTLVKALQLEGQIWCVSDPKRGIVLTDRALSTLRDLDKAGTQKAGSLDALYTNIGINYLELGKAALADKDRRTAMDALDRLQEAMPHLTDAERNSFTGPYEELHTALYKDPGRQAK